MFSIGGNVQKSISRKRDRRSLIGGYPSESAHREEQEHVTFRAITERLSERRFFKEFRIFRIFKNFKMAAEIVIYIVGT
jgi:hypothetical protein